jgi:hypothetical protein
MVRFWIVALSALGLASCGTTAPTSVSGPSGQVIARAKCSGSSAACFSQAAAACGGGSYQVLDSESHAGGLLADIMPGPVTWYTMQFQCGASDGRLPSFPFNGPSTGEAMANLSANMAEMSRPPESTTTRCSSFGNEVTCRSSAY